jgi:prepilin-type N-terminal cleavage/methylation domain-containing protein
MRDAHVTTRNAAPRAFTLVEMLVVLGIIALVMSMSIPMFVPMTRAGKLDAAKDAVKSACILARSKAIQERCDYAVVLLQAEQAVLILNYEDLRSAGAPANFPAQQPFAPNWVDNYDPPTPESRWTVLENRSAERIRYLPEGCRFDLNANRPTGTLAVEAPAWAYVFHPNGSAWTLPGNAENKRDTWSVTTYMKSGNPAGPRIYGPEDREWADIIVYATTGQPTSQ